MSAPLPGTTMQASVGVRQPLIDGIEKVTGRALYTACLLYTSDAADE